MKAILYGVAESKSVRILRETARSFLNSTVPENDIESIIIALSEAANNCLIHAKTEFVVELHVDHHKITVKITDYGAKYFDGNDFIPPAPGIYAGKMGIKTIRALMDDACWSYDGGTTVTMTKRVIATSAVEKHMPLAI